MSGGAGIWFKLELFACLVLVVYLSLSPVLLSPLIRDIHILAVVACLSLVKAFYLLRKAFLVLFTNLYFSNELLNCLFFKSLITGFGLKMYSDMVKDKKSQHRMR